MRKLWLTGLVGLVFLLGSGIANAINIDFGQIPGGSIQFIGELGQFTFNSPATGNNIEMTSGNDALGDEGRIEGIFTISSQVKDGDISATVDGIGKLTIDDGNSGILTADVKWDRIYEMATENAGSFGSINGQANLMNIKYTGTESDWSQFKDKTGTIIVTFQFSEEISLFDLVNREISTSLSGSMRVPVADAGSMMLMLGISMVGVEMLRRKVAA